MPVICIGPICIPMNLLLPFLLGVLHSYGWFTWIKKEWVTFRYWRQRIDQWRGVAPKPSPSTAAAGTAVNGPKSAAGTAGKAGAGSASGFVAAGISQGSGVGCGPSCSSNGTCGPAQDEAQTAGASQGAADASGAQRHPSQQGLAQRSKA